MQDVDSWENGIDIFKGKKQIDDTFHNEPPWSIIGPRGIIAFRFFFFFFLGFI